MLQKTSYAVFLIIYIKCVETTGIKSFHGVRTDENPKSSCHKIDNVISTGRCLAKCGILMDKIIMVSHDKSSKICMCCNDITGSDIIGSNWKTFVPLPCADGYATYSLMSYQICLKYFPVPVTYSTAQANCQAEGGDLIKIDSQEKYDIFKDCHVPIANNTILQVWVQGEKVGGQWQFDDGTPIPDFCPISLSNRPEEIHLRARGTTSFVCLDDAYFHQRHYSCEYHRLLAINN